MGSCVWTSKDPIRFGGGLNLYLYVTNDPFNRRDANGRGGAGGWGGGSGGGGGWGGGGSSGSSDPPPCPSDPPIFCDKKAGADDGTCHDKAFIYCTYSCSDGTEKTQRQNVTQCQFADSVDADKECNPTVVK